MRPFYCRVGSKRKVSKGLIKLFPDHTKYVEAFFGGGAVFFEKEPSKVEVINDLDPVLIRDYKLLKKAPTDVSKYKVIRDEAGQNKFLREKHTSTADRIVEALFRRCNGFGGKYIKEGTDPKVFTHWNRTRKNTTHEHKLQAIADYKKRINHATLTQEPYESVLRKHDGKDTFFFLDPPYEDSKSLDYAKGSEVFDFHKFHDDVAKVKGKFMITINDSSFLRKLFQDFNVYRYVVKGHHSPTSKIGQKDRRELLITNYPLEKTWKKTLRGGMLKTDEEEDEEEEMRGGVKGIMGEDAALDLFLNRYFAATDYARIHGINVDHICALIVAFILEGYLNYSNEQFVVQITQELMRTANSPNVADRGIATEKLVTIFKNAGMKINYWTPSSFDKNNNHDPEYEKLLKFAKQNGYPVVILVPAHTFIVIPGLAERGRTVLYNFDCINGAKYEAIEDDEYGNIQVDENGKIKTKIVGLNYFNVDTEPTVYGVFVVHSERTTQEEMNVVGSQIQQVKLKLKEILHASNHRTITAKQFVDKIEEFIKQYEDAFFNLLEKVNTENIKPVLIKIKKFIESFRENPSINDLELFENANDLYNILNNQWLYMNKTENAYETIKFKHNLLLGFIAELTKIHKGLESIIEYYTEDRIDEEYFQEIVTEIRNNLESIINKDDYDSKFLLREFIKLTNINPNVVEEREGVFHITDNPQFIYLFVFDFIRWLEIYSNNYERGINQLEGLPDDFGQNTNTDAGQNTNTDATSNAGQNTNTDAGQNSNTGAVSNAGQNTNTDASNIGEGRPHLFGAGKTAVEHQLSVIGFSPDAYLKKIKAAAKKHGYDPASISFSDDKTHKLEIKTPDGKVVRFGRTGYGDFHIWSHLESHGEAPAGIAKKKQHVFTVSHSAIKGNWKKDKYSPNNLALNLLW